LNDNPIAWLEITDACNLSCDGCYRLRMTGHKPLEAIREEILFYRRWRNCDCISIAGGEPLLHPEIVDIVRCIAGAGMQPIIITNGVLLTVERLRELKDAGLVGITIHIDSTQNRPGWTGKSEVQLNDLRAQYADMVAEVGGICLYFNLTIREQSLPQLPAVVAWARARIDRVHGLALITYRRATVQACEQLQATRPDVLPAALSYAPADADETFIKGPELCELLMRQCPGYRPAAYLGGTQQHATFKWLTAVMIGTRSGCLGSFGPRALELVQMCHHLFTGRYFVYMRSSRVGILVFLLGLVDGGVRRACLRWLGQVVRRPWRLFDRICVQGLGIIQAPDILPDGRVEMCDSCPDMTYYEGRLVHSCRLDEHRLFGDYVFGAAARQPAPRQPALQPMDPT
jgi:hypothetical protein